MTVALTGATALGVVLASLFESPDEPAAADGPLVRHAAQPEWRDPGSGYLRRNVSPPSHAIQIVDVRSPRASAWRLTRAARTGGAPADLGAGAGAIDITHGKVRHRLRAGDCLAMELDRPTMFHNPTRKTTRYAVVILSEPRARR